MSKVADAASPLHVRTIRVAAAASPRVPHGLSASRPRRRRECSAEYRVAAAAPPRRCGSLHLQHFSLVSLLPQAAPPAKATPPVAKHHASAGTSERARRAWQPEKHKSTSGAIAQRRLRQRSSARSPEIARARGDGRAKRAALPRPWPGTRATAWPSRRGPSPRAASWAVSDV